MISLVLGLLPGTLLISLSLGLSAVVVLAGGALQSDSETSGATLELVDDAGATHQVEALT